MLLALHYRAMRRCCWNIICNIAGPASHRDANLRSGALLVMSGAIFYVSIASFSVAFCVAANDV